ncbi:MAG TPA: hypothetical protein GX391_01630 [Firmicutes bacterium]|nr:hypothetical protein [Bacillota bacterium]
MEAKTLGRIGRAFLLIGLLVCLWGQLPPAVATTSGERKVVVLTMERMALEEWATGKLPNLTVLMDRSALGLLSLRTVGQLTTEKVYNAIGAGGMVPAGAAARWAYDQDEALGVQTAGEAYRHFYQKTPGNGPVHLGVPKLRAEMAKAYSYRCGRLGQTLREAGLHTAVLGNCDTHDRINRASVLLAMDEAGRLDLGRVGPALLTRDPAFPFGLRTDYRRLLLGYCQVRATADLIVLTTGDLERLERYRSQLTDPALAKAKAGTLRRWDMFLGRLLQEVDFGTTLLVVLVPTPPDVLIQAGERMTPVLFCGPGFGQGLVYSHSTRVKGLMTPADLTATLLDFYGLPVPEDVDGRPVKVLPGTVGELLKAHRWWRNNYRQRWPILTGYVALLALVFFAGLAGLSFYRCRWQQEGLRRLALVLLGVPLALLLISWLNPYTPVVTAFLTLAVAGGTAYAITRLFQNDLHRVAAIAAVTALVILVDLLTGAHLLKGSILGYSVMLGARFYGLGNEYMGVVLGAVLMGLAGLYDVVNRPSRRVLLLIVAAVMACVAVLIIHPRFGANVGGGIAATLGFCLALLLFAGKRIRLKEGLFLLGITVIVVSLMAGLDSFTGYGNTHLGQNLKLIRAYGITAALRIITRKWQMNNGLIAATPWTRVLLLFVLALPVIFRRPSGLLKRAFCRYPSFLPGLKACVGTALVAFLVNDSGIVVAGTTMIYGGLGMFYILLGEASVSEGDRLAAKTLSTTGGIGLGD